MNFSKEASEFTTQQKSMNSSTKYMRNVLIFQLITQFQTKLTCDIGWTDLGTWGSLYNQVEHDGYKNAIVGDIVKLYNSSNNVISNPTDKLVVIDGLDNFIVVNTEDALLVCEKEDEQKIKQFVTDLSSTKKYKKYI